MRSVVTRRRVALLSILVAAGAQAGCGGASPTLGDAVPSPLAAEEIAATLNDHRLGRSGGWLWRRWEYTGTHRKDGTIIGEIAWHGGGERAEGTWWLDADGSYCRKWSNHWGGGEPGCFRVSRAGDLVVFDHLRGSRGDATRYVYRLAPVSGGAG